MRARFVFAGLALATSMAVAVVAQTPAQVEAEPILKLRSGETPVEGECLTEEELELIAGLNALRRPTVGREGQDHGDDPAPFNPHYMVGTWEIEGVLPDSALGDAGEFLGTETVRYTGDCTYESTLEATLGDEPLTVSARMIYDRRSSYLVRLEDDSRGFELLKVGTVGGDPGGYYSHHWEAPPVDRDGTSVRLRGRTYMTSPMAYQLRMQVSADGGSYVNFGTVRWRRAGSTP